MNPIPGARLQEHAKMPMMVRMTTLDGVQIYVNPARVTLVSDKGDHAGIHYDGNLSAYVQIRGGLEAVAKALNQAIVDDR